MRRARRRRLEPTGWAVLGGLISLVLPAIDRAPAGAHAMRGRNTISANGLKIEGDGFYIWDEDKREAESWAMELTGPAFPEEI